MKILGWVLGVLGVMGSINAQAAVMVAPVEGTNLDPGEVEAISQTVASAYQVAQAEAVIPMPEARRALEQTGGVQEAAKKLGASEYIYATAVRLDTRIVITATRYAVNGAPLRSVKMTATGLDDVEPASERLAKALSSHQESNASQALDTVTTTESRRPNRTWSEKVTGFKAGLIYPIGWGHELSPMMSAGFALRVDSNSHFLEFGVGLVLPANPGDDHRLSYGGVYGDIGANFYLAHASTSPYLGFGLMPRLVSQEVTNLAPYGQAGMMFFRESSTRLYADFRVAQNVLPVGFASSSQYDATSGTYTSNHPPNLYPTELSFHVGVGW